ncbi:MAG: carboxypeptidase regulatory-like domain-containing protein [Planctomycetes bacterium]|nr:carboxypeptidase regulatory-like domain-containing protein [Planctomycetota bacterium]
MIKPFTQLATLLLMLFSTAACNIGDDKPHTVMVSADPAGRKYGDIRLIVTDAVSGREFASKHLPTSWAIPIKLPPRREFKFQVFMIDGFVSEIESVHSRAGATDSIHFRYYRFDGVEITARVTDSVTGEPIPTSTVELYDDGSGRLGVTQSDHSGNVRFTFPKNREGLEIGRKMRLEVRISGYRVLNHRFTRDNQSQQLSVALEPVGEDVTFIILDSWDSSPIEGATVSGTTYGVDVPTFSGKTGREGSMTIRLEAGDYTVAVDAPGFESFGSSSRKESIRDSELHHGKPPSWRLGDMPSSRTIRLKATK